MGKRENADATVIRHGKVRQRSIKIIMPSRDSALHENHNAEPGLSAP